MLFEPDALEDVILGKVSNSNAKNKLPISKKIKASEVIMPTCSNNYLFDLISLEKNVLKIVTTYENSHKDLKNRVIIWKIPS